MRAETVKVILYLLEAVVSVLILYSMVYFNTVKVVAVVLNCNSSIYVVSSSIQ